MKGILISGTEAKKKKFVGYTALIKYVVSPFNFGLFGFASFFFVLIVSRYIGVIIGTYTIFFIDIEDILLSLIGFIFVFTIKSLENFKTNSK